MRHPHAVLAALVLLAACASSTASTSTTGAGTTGAPATTAAAPTSAAAATTSAGPTSTAAPTTIAPTTGAPTTGAPTTAAATAAPTTLAVAHLRGTAYTFNTPTPIAGATITLAELPGVQATTGADGSYDLAVPVGSSVTPRVSAPGHHSISLQTFTLDAAHDGTSVTGANFQTPSDDIYAALKSLVGGFIGKDPFAGGCVIVTTVSDPKVVGMTFEQFINFHPHGLAGATATITPAAATPIYFNASVIPDQAQHTTSVDGGVMWTNVPPGRYTLSATAPGHTFTTIAINCVTGGVVNASPTWGLHATS